MNRKTEVVTVIVPVYNGERYIREALRSILEQEYSPLEIIVVDDGSTDGVAAILAREFPGVRCLSQAHAGLSAARNAGLARVESGWIGFLDADDLWAPEKLRMQMKALESQPELEAVFGHIRQFYSPEDADRLSRTYRIAQEILPGIHADTMLISAAAIRRIGVFNPAVAMGEFLDWFARAQEAGLAYAVLPDVLAFRRNSQLQYEHHQQAECRPRICEVAQGGSGSKAEQVNLIDRSGPFFFVAVFGEGFFPKKDFFHDTSQLLAYRRSKSRHILHAGIPKPASASVRRVGTKVPALRRAVDRSGIG